MSDTPWLSIIGLGEDGPEGLSAASRSALKNAEIVMGPPRHLSLLTLFAPVQAAQQIEWPIPFADGIEKMRALHGRKVAVLVSGDPFWYGAGTTLSRHLTDRDWQAFPGPSTFSLAASRMGWPLETTECFGLHAAPLSRLRPALAKGTRMIVLLRDGDAVAHLATYLTAEGFGTSKLTVLYALGGPRETRQDICADSCPKAGFQHPLCVAIKVKGDGVSLPLASGRPDRWFDNDGQITKRPVRALTLSALAPQPFEHLWDIGGGSGSVGIEWLLSHPTLRATTIEPHLDRAATIRTNANRLGVDRLDVITGKAPDILTDLPKPDAVFVGGGLGTELLGWLTQNLSAGTRLVANAVTLETEALLIDIHHRLGGELLRVELSTAGILGPRRGWKASYPITQWSHIL